MSRGDSVATPRGRVTVSMVLIVVASLLLPLAGVTVWVRNLVLDSSRYVDTVSPLSKNKVVQEAVARDVAKRAAAALDIEQRAKEVLPDRAKFLAVPIAAAAQQLADDATLKLLESEQFDKFWRLANRRAHDQVVAALTGRRGPVITNYDGKVVLDLGPLVLEVAKKLGELGVGVPKNIDIRKLDVRFVLIDSSELKSAQNYARLLDRGAWGLPLLTVLLYALAIFIAPRRRRALLRAGVGITIAMAMSVIALGFARTHYLDHLPAAQSRAAAAAIFDTVTRFMKRGLYALLATGLLVCLVAWSAGPSRTAAVARRQWNRTLGRAGEELNEAIEIGPINRWVAQNVKALRAGLFAVLLLVLVAWDQPSGAVVLFLGGVALLGLGVIQVLGAGRSRSDASAGSA